MSILDRIRADYEARPKTWRDEIEVIDYYPPLSPQNVIRDYWAINNASVRMANCDRGRNKGQGMAETAVTHAIAEHEIKLKRVTRRKGQYLCGWKSQARWGCDRVTSLDPVNCPQCAKVITTLGLNPSLRIKDGFWD